MRCTKRTPIDDDAENAVIRPLEACVSLSTEGTIFSRNLSSAGRDLFYVGTVIRKDSQYGRTETGGLMEKFSSKFFCRISHMPLANRRQYLLKSHL